MYCKFVLERSDENVLLSVWVVRLNTEVQRSLQENQISVKFRFLRSFNGTITFFLLQYLIQNIYI